MLIDAYKCYWKYTQGVNFGVRNYGRKGWGRGKIYFSFYIFQYGLNISLHACITFYLKLTFWFKINFILRTRHCLCPKGLTQSIEGEIIMNPRYGEGPAPPCPLLLLLQLSGQSCHSRDFLLSRTTSWCQEHVGQVTYSQLMVPPGIPQASIQPWHGQLNRVMSRQSKTCHQAISAQTIRLWRAERWAQNLSLESLWAPALAGPILICTQFQWAQWLGFPVPSRSKTAK